MKIASILIFVLILSGVCFAQPEKLNYQAVARNTSGNIVSNQNISVRFSIRRGSASGPIQYQETHSVTTNQFGLFTAAIGGGTVISGNFSNIGWGDDDMFLEVEMDASGGSNYTSMGTSQLLSVPYALLAKKVQGGLRGNGTAGYLGVFTQPDELVDSRVYHTNSFIGIGTSIPHSTERLRIFQNVAPGGHGGVNISTDLRNGRPSLSFYNGEFSLIYMDGIDTNKLKFEVNGVRMAISRDGYVGIGKTNPRTTLDVAGGNWDLTNTWGDIRIGDPQYSLMMGIATGGSGAGDATIAAKGGTNRLFLGSGSTPDEQRLVTLLNGYYVGIGTTDPSSRLEVRAFGHSIKLGDLSGGFTGIEIFRGSSGAKYAIHNGSFYLTFKYGADSATALSGIARFNGTTAFEPFNNNVTSLGSSSLRWTAVFATNGTIQTSDEQHKTNVNRVPYGLREVMQLRPVAYRWKNETLNFNGKKSLGFMAQDLEKIIPDVVVHAPVESDKETGDIPKEATHYGVKYADLIPVLTRAIQEQQVMIEALQKQIMDLRKK
jgi:hypothetical protein